jgi:threonyl-tRNA synthetase
MLHRAALGSLERFIGVLIEHHAGLLPFWLAPVQVAVLNISEKQAEYAKEVAAKLQHAGIRVNLDLANEKIGYKIREQSMQKVPFLLVIGDNEQAEATVTVRAQDGRNLGNMPVAEFIASHCQV